MVSKKTLKRMLR